MKDFSNMPLCLSFDDVMIIPRHSTIKSRSEPNTRTKIGTVSMDIPIISSPMDTITETDMALAMVTSGGMGIIHRFLEPSRQASMLREVFSRIEESESLNKDIENSYGRVGVAIGTGDSELERLKVILSKVGKDRATTVAIDVANGFSSYMRDMIQRVRDLGGEKLNIIAGNVATGDGYSYLSSSGANAVRVGIGGGCFVPGSMVLTADGHKPIESISIGDAVMTHTGSWKSVVNTMIFDRDEEIVCINGINCTKNHEFYVVKKSDEKFITEDNIHDYAFWIEADHIDVENHLLIEMD